ncbi:hypothetical protein EXIGLDRAFT_718203 [Exidia glandulosa HHB12029]|uniref:Uncharacterized protein n=1 Tax=Exidia glandulosa HHB12029 TaxID=1314781 RepID=A0A165HVV3_EXIGL|nr:hypothetical protein EXIGLDRAFT_718203 [Exidia glandulosa HHB12029]
MVPTPLTIPITFTQSGDAISTFDQQCSEATFTCITAWHSSDASGAALGCADGSFFLLRPTEPGTSHISLSNSPAPASPALLPLPSPPLTDSSPRSSRLLNPFSVPGRATAAVSVSKEQVEAPKNYVDFDPEQEKLAALIQKPATGAVASLRRQADTDEGTSSTRASSRVQSRAQSPALVRPGVPLHTAPPSTSPFPSLAPCARVFPPRIGAAHSITALHALDDAVTLVTLQESGDLAIYDIRDGFCTAGISLVSAPQLAPPPNAQAAIDGTWMWYRLHILPATDNTLILASATESWTLGSSDPNVADTPTTRCRIALARRSAHHELEKIGEWMLDATPASVNAFIDATGTPTLSFLDSKSQLVSQTIHIVPHPRSEATEATPAPTTTTVGPITLNVNINIPNPFKPRNGASADAPHVEKPKLQAGLVELGERRMHGAARVEGDVLGSSAGAIWSAGGVCLYILTGEVPRFGWVATDAHPAQDVRWVSDNKVVIVTELQATTYRLKSRTSSSLEFQQLSAFSLPGTHVFTSTISSPSLLCALRMSSSGSCRIVTAPLSASSSRPSKPRTTWRAPPPPEKRTQHPAKVTALLPVELQAIVMGYSNGALARGRFGSLEHPPALEIDGAPLEKLFYFRNEPESTTPPLIIGGDGAGAILVWEYPSLKFKRKWTRFTTCLARVVPLRGTHVGRLKGHALCIAEDGTAVILDPAALELVCVLPGSPAPLERIALAEDNLLLFYADGRARLWDVKTMEFWRAMARHKAEELVHQGEWLDVRVDSAPEVPDKIIRAMNRGDGEASSTILLDVRAVNETTSPPPQSFSFIRRQGGATTHDADALPPDHDNLQPAAVSPQHIKIVSSLLPALLSRGMNDDIDEFLSSRLDINVEEAIIGAFSDLGSIVLHSPRTSAEMWTISRKYTAARLLATLTLLRICLGFSDWEKDASAAIAFYVVALPDYIGPAFESPCLEFLARYWYDTSAELRQAARTLFESTASRMSDQETIAFVEKWQHELPSLQPDSDKQDPRAARALLLTGHLAVEKQSLLSVSTLTDIAKSINLYLHDPTSPHRTLAIELCSQGFQIWQHYFDAMEMLRSLFGLATNMRKDASSIAPAARLAVLQIASSSTPLFMATLSLDILKPRNLAHRKSTMGLIAFFIRKKPLVLYPNLTRLVEAVVKSLDPNNSTDRDAVQDAATEILGQVVKTFPTVDFHMPTQRLAVGTTEGAVVMFDLKTATRLYVLEGYHTRLTALSFSPDGRRLAGVSLEESQVNIWKVGSSFSSFFKPGAPPAGAAPFKTYPFNVGDEARMTIASTLDWVSFEWPTERSARLKIRDSTLTFAT